jgi:hypothetical protein
LVIGQQKDSTLIKMWLHFGRKSSKIAIFGKFTDFWVVFCSFWGVVCPWHYIKIFFGCKASFSLKNFLSPIKIDERSIFHPSKHTTVLPAPPPKIFKNFFHLDIWSLVQYGAPDYPPSQKLQLFVIWGSPKKNSSSLSSYTFSTIVT